MRLMICMITSFCSFAIAFSPRYPSLSWLFDWHLSCGRIVWILLGHTWWHILWFRSQACCITGIDCVLALCFVLLLTVHMFYRIGDSGDFSRDIVKIFAINISQFNQIREWPTVHSLYTHRAIKCTKWKFVSVLCLDVKPGMIPMLNSFH